MATREILYCGHPVLRRKARRVPSITPEIAQLLDDLTQTMIEAPGLGLAAPQIGESVRAIVVREDGDDDEEIYCLVNPRILEREGEAEAVEGCLSFPTLHGTVLRAQRVVAEGVNQRGENVQVEAEGLLARALQHEIDHLNGVLFVDRVQPESLGWLVPDEDDEDGFRIEPTTLEEVTKVFQRLREEKGQV